MTIYVWYDLEEKPDDFTGDYYFYIDNGLLVVCKRDVADPVMTYNKDCWYKVLNYEGELNER